MATEKSMVDTFNETLNNLKTTIDSKIEKIQKNRKKFNDNVETELGGVNERIKNINGRLEKILFTISDLQDKQKTNSNSIATMTKEMTTMQSEKDKLQEENKQEQLKVATLEKEKADLEAEKDKFEMESKGSSKAIEALKASKDSEKDQKIKELQEQHDNALKVLNGNIDEKTKEIEQFTKSDVELNAKITKLESQIQGLGKDIESKSKANQDIEGVLSSAIENVKSIINTINKLPDANDFVEISPLFEEIKKSLTETEALLSRFENRGKTNVQKIAQQIEENINPNRPPPVPTDPQNIPRTDEQSNRPPLPPFNMNVGQVADENQDEDGDFETLNVTPAPWKTIPDAKVINEQKIKKFIKGIRVKVKNKDDGYSPGVVKEVLNKDTEKPTYVVKLDDNSTREVSLSDIESPEFYDHPVFGGAKKKPKRKSKNKTMKKKKKVTKKKLAIKKKKKYTQKKIR